MRPRRRREGMTLIEIMLAIAILTMISAMVWSAFVQSSRNKDIIEDEADRYHVVRITLERMSRELSMAFVSVHINRSPSLQKMKTAFIGHDEGGGDRLDFTSFSHQRLYRDAHESDQNELSYFVTRHPDEPGVQVLARREQNRIDEYPERGGRVQILVEDVRDFQLDYLDPQSNEWLASWDSTQAAQQPNRLPSQVRIRLTVADPSDPDQETTFATRASLPLVWGLNHASYNP